MNEKPEDPMRELRKKLSAYFPPNAVEWKPQSISGNRALAVAFIDARTVMKRLDDCLGIDGWQDSYAVLPDGCVVCTLRCRLGGEWITKQDVGGESDQKDEGDKRKASFSDALKRAAVKFGIGRFIYSLPSQWVEYDPQKRQFVKPPQLPDWAIPKPRTARPTLPAEPALAGTVERPAIISAEQLARLRALLDQKGGLEAWQHVKAAFNLDRQAQPAGLPAILWAEVMRRLVTEPDVAEETSRGGSHHALHPTPVRRGDPSA